MKNAKRPVEVVKVVKVMVDQLLADATMQPRARTSAETISKYRVVFQNSPKSPFPPITVARITNERDERGRLTVVDGYHRVAAARLAGVKSISAVVVEVTRAEAEWMAARANREHGLPLSGKDMVEVFKRYVRARENVEVSGELKSYGAITADLGGMKSKATLQRWMTRMFPSVAARMAGHDEEHTAGAKEELLDQATEAEERLVNYVEGAVRVIRGMEKEQRRAVDQDARNKAMTDEERTQRARGYAVGAVIDAVSSVLAAAALALGMDEAEVMRAAEASNRARAEATLREAALESDF